MRKIMKKSMLLVIFSFALTLFASGGLAAVGDVTTDGFNPTENEELVIGVFAAPSGDEDENEGDPDGYKEGWDSDVLQNAPSGSGSLDALRAQFIKIWIIFSSQGPF